MTLRRINAILSVASAVLFSAHEVIGTLYTNDLVRVEAPYLIWVGIGAIGVHAVLCIFTSKQMLEDKKRPPSRKKKGHLLKKWITGVILGALVATHVVAAYGGSAWAAATSVLAITLAVHACVSSKSLVTDLGLPSRYRFAPRVFIIAITLACALIAMVR